MRCRICGGRLEPRTSDLPFQLSDTTIVVIRGLPVNRCIQCQDTELEHSVMLRVEQLLTSVNRSTELEALRYAA